MPRCVIWPGVIRCSPASLPGLGPCDVLATAKVDLFHALLRSIIYQQLHGKAAAAIHGRVLKMTGLASGRRGAATVLAVPDDLLRSAGLSANKLLAIRDLAAKTLDGTVPTARMAAQLGDEELIERLTAVRGIGPWTVHMLMIFHLGRPDVMPTGDFAIRKAFSLLYRRGRPVTPEAICAMRGFGSRIARWRAGICGARWPALKPIDFAIASPEKPFHVTRADFSDSLGLTIDII